MSPTSWVQRSDVSAWDKTADWPGKEELLLEHLMHNEFICRNRPYQWSCRVKLRVRKRLHEEDLQTTHI